MTLNGCTNFSSQNVVVNPLPQASLNNNGPISANQPQMTLTAEGSTYQFSAGANQQNPPSGNTATLTTPGTYQVTVTSTQGC